MRDWNCRVICSSRSTSLVIRRKHKPQSNIQETLAFTFVYLNKYIYMCVYVCIYIYIYKGLYALSKDVMRPFDAQRTLKSLEYNGVLTECERTNIIRMAAECNTFKSVSNIRDEV
jgi:hypothetical protein